MILKLDIKNFKRFDHIEIPLDQNVVFIGPNNSGKTTALQALYLWNLAFNKWNEKKTDSKSSDAVAIYRKDIFAISTPHTRNLWKDLKSKKKNENIPIEIHLQILYQDNVYNIGFEYKYFT